MCGAIHIGCLEVANRGRLAGGVSGLADRQEDIIVAREYLALKAGRGCLDLQVGQAMVAVAEIARGVLGSREVVSGVWLCTGVDSVQAVWGRLRAAVGTAAKEDNGVGEPWRPGCEGADGEAEGKTERRARRIRIGQLLGNWLS